MAVKFVAEAGSRNNPKNMKTDVISKDTELHKKEARIITSISVSTGAGYSYVESVLISVQLARINYCTVIICDLFYNL